MMVENIDCAEGGGVLFWNVLRSSLYAGGFCCGNPMVFGLVGVKCILRDVV
jgi:hypothetical protein